MPVTDQQYENIVAALAQAYVQRNSYNGEKLKLDQMHSDLSMQLIHAKAARDKELCKHILESILENRRAEGLLALEYGRQVCKTLKANSSDH